jgi:hypothetical protein
MSEACRTHWRAKNTCEIFLEDLKGLNDLENLHVNGKIQL